MSKSNFFPLLKFTRNWSYYMCAKVYEHIFCRFCWGGGFKTYLPPCIYVGLNPETHPIYIMVLAVRRNGFVLVVFDVFWVIFWFLLIFFHFFSFFFHFFFRFFSIFIYFLFYFIYFFNFSTFFSNFNFFATVFFDFFDVFFKILFIFRFFSCF